MTKLAVKIPVIESEKGWGRKIDDYMVCLSKEDAEKFRSEFNSKNEEDSAPDWYMQVEGEPIAIDITDKQHEYLMDQNSKRGWLKTLNSL